VIVPAVSYAATALAPLYVGAKPVFADVTREDLTLDPKSCERLLTSSTRAIVFVHLYGTSGTLYEIVDLCNRHGLRLIQDCAQSLGTRLSGRLVGGEGDATCFSFFETKTVSVGEGGAVLIKDEESLEKGRRLRHHGMDVASGCRNIELLGYNYKMSELQAAASLAQLGRLDRLAQLRRKFATVVQTAFKATVELQKTPDGEVTCWDKVCLLFKDGESRERARRLAKPLGARRYLYRPLCDEPLFQGCRHDSSLTNARAFCDRHLVIQCSPVFDKPELNSLCRRFVDQFVNQPDQPVEGWPP
jgi:perosamine synthetase